MIEYLNSILKTIIIHFRRNIFNFSLIDEFIFMALNIQTRHQTHVRERTKRTMLIFLGQQKSIHFSS